MSASSKLFLAGVILCFGAFGSAHKAMLHEEASSRLNGFTISHGYSPASVWDYLFFFLLTCSIGLIVAAVKLRR